MSPLALRATRLLLSAVVIASAGACASQSGPEHTGGLHRIVESGVLRIGTSGEQPPLTMTSQSGELLGLDVALGRVLARSMGVEAEFVKKPFGQLLAALEHRELDLVMSGVTITPDRARRVAFIGPYYTSGKSLLTRSPELAAVTAAADLDSSELRLAALMGSTSELFVSNTLPKARLEATPSLNEAIQKVIDGDVDALVADRETCAFAVLRHPDAGLIAGNAIFTIEPMGIAAPLDEPRLVNLVQIYLDALGKRGALEKATAFWLNDPSWVKELR